MFPKFLSPALSLSLVLAATSASAMAPFVEKAFAAGKTYGPYTTSEEMVRAVLDRKANLSTTFRTFVDDLKEERNRFLSGGYSPLEKARISACDAKMVLFGRVVQSAAFGKGMQVFRKFAKDLSPESDAFRH